MDRREAKVLIQGEVDKVAERVWVAAVWDMVRLSVLCQQGRVRVPVDQASFVYRGDSWPDDIKGHTMPVIAAVVKDDVLGDGAALVESYQKITGAAANLVDGLCTKAECARLGCAKQRSGR